MLLAVNISNKETKLGGFENNELKFTACISTKPSQTPTDNAAYINSVLNIYKIPPEKIKASIIASVAPFCTDAVREGIKILAGINPVLIGPGIKTGVNILTDNPAEMGAEIVCAAAAAIKKYAAPQIIVIFGTATTFAVVNEKKQLIGTIITPGVLLSLESLTKETALLPQTNLKKPLRAIGKNSAESIESGIFHSTNAMVTGIIKEIEAELNSTAEIIITGSIGKIYSAKSQKIKFDENLVLDGLNLIYNKNVDKK